MEVSGEDLVLVSLKVQGWVGGIERLTPGLVNDAWRKDDIQISQM